jgi:crotonobetainyl-CoA:carnitine CoA-transferase CaiB-like acyl-CoA transferase
VLTDPLSHADVYAGLQATIAILAALRQREETGRGQYIDVAMTAVLLSINERAHVDLDGVDTGAEPAILGAADAPHFRGPGGEHLVVAQSLIGSLTFRNYLRAMRRSDLAADPRFCTAAQRLANYDALHGLVQTWMRGFHDLDALDAQLDEAKIAIGVIRTTNDLAKTEWARYWNAVREVPDRAGGTYRLPGHPWRFSGATLDQTSPPRFRGEDNVTVLRELGVADAEIQRAIEAGILLRDSAAR